MENTNENISNTEVETSEPAVSSLSVMDNSVMAVHSALGGSFCSFDTSTVEGKKRVFRAMSNPDVRLKSMINKQIRVVDVFAKATTLTNEDTGEVRDGVTVVFFDDLGVSYASTSTGVANATRAMLEIYGEPANWTEPVTIMPKEVSVKKGNMLTFEIV